MLTLSFPFQKTPENAALSILLFPDLLEFPEKFLLSFGQVLRGPDENLDDLVSFSVASQAGKAFSADAKELPVFGSLGDRKDPFAVECRDFYFSSECSLSKAERNLTDDIVPLAGKKVVAFDEEKDVKVSGWAAAVSGFTFSADA